MAQASEELLIKIDIVDSDSANRINAISEELNHLKVTQKDYEQAVKEGKQLTTEQGKEYVAVKARIADLNKELNAHTKALQKENQEQAKNKDSLNAMRTQLKSLIKEYDNMSKAERESVEIGYKKRDEINALTDQIKELEEGTQRYQRNVGNYTNAIRDALGGSIPTIGRVSDALIGLKTSTGWIGLAIQAIVAVFGALATAFNRTEGNADKMKGSLGKLRGLFVMLQQALEPLVKGLVDGFVKALDMAFNALGWLGDKIQSFLRAVNLNGLADKMQEYADKVQATATANEELTVSQEKLTRAMKESRRQQLEFQTEQEKFRQTRDDATKSTEEQVEANNNLLASIQKQKEVEGGLAQQQITLAQKRIELYGRTTENVDALNEAKENYADIMERLTGKESEALKWQNDYIAKLKEEAQILDEIIAKVTTINPYKESKKKTDEEDDESDDVEDVVALMIDVNNKKLETERLSINERRRLREENLAIEIAQMTAQGKSLEEIAKHKAKREYEIDRDGWKDRAELLNSYASLSQATANNVIDSIEEIARANGASEEYMKKLAVAKIAINSATAIAQGVSGAMAVPFPANIPAIIATISAIVSGIAQAKSALSQANVPKFAQGGLVTGEGTATSDSIPAMLSNGESVMTARATSAYSGILSALNTSVGGAPIGESTKTKGTQQLVQQFADAVANTPIYTAVTDINEGQARVAKIVDNSNY